MKSLEDTYVPVGTSNDNVVSMINDVIRGYQINFYDEELSIEGWMHNKDLHVIFICWERVINDVLEDDGSSLYICLLLTLTQ